MGMVDVYILYPRVSFKISIKSISGNAYLSVSFYTLVDSVVIMVIAFYVVVIYSC